MHMLPLPADHADQQHEFARQDRRNQGPVPLPPSLPRTLQVLLLRPVAPFGNISDMPRRSRVLTSDQDYSTSSFETCSFVQRSMLSCSTLGEHKMNEIYGFQTDQRQNNS